MLLIRGEKRCLAHTLILAAPRIRVVLSNATVISVFMFLTPPRHAAGYGHMRADVFWHTSGGVCGTLEPLLCVCALMCPCVYMLAAQWSPW